jgi:hypothetical protein
MRWGFIKQFPKLFLVCGVLLASTGLFATWWVTHRAKLALTNRPHLVTEDIAPKVARVVEAPKRLLLVDNDLYNLDTGVVIFNNWLKGGTPAALFYDAQAKKVIARYERGFVRYRLDGEEDAVLVQKFQPAFSHDFRWAVYAKEKDLWRADIDWSGFRFANERKLTAIEQFNELYFAKNVILGGGKAMIVRNMNQLLRVDLESGDVQPTRVPVGEIGKRRSPSGGFLVGVQGGQFYCYDVETDDTKTIAIGRGAMNDYQWLGNDRCTAIAAGRAVVLYDRLKNTLNEVAALPVQCGRIGEPSPDGRYVFCIGGDSGYLVDLVNKEVVPVVGGAGVKWVSSDRFVFSREVPNSKLRGTWIQTVGEGERRVALEPFLVDKSGPMLMVSPAGEIVYATKHGLSKMKPDGDGAAEFIKLRRTPLRVLGIADWEPPAG